MDCSHPSIYHGMCVVCGKNIDTTGGQGSSKTDAKTTANSYKTALNVSGGKVLQLSAEEAASVTASKVNNLRNSKKLALVLDLDHTLLHAIQVEGQTPSRISATAKVIENTVGIGSGDGPDDNLVHHLPIEEIDRLTIKHLVMKKRPYLDEFLEKASEFCQMTVYTAGTRRYAEAVARVIDPTRRYFADRIVSRCDVANIRADGNDKSLERIYPGDASMAVIMDDREDVWRGAQNEQLLLVKPFMHFDPRPSDAAAAASGATAATADNASSPPPDALGTVARGVPTGGNGTVPVISSPVISLCAAPTGESAGRIAKVAALYSFEHSSLDDQLRRCLQVLRLIHAQYYRVEPTPIPASALIEGGSAESKESSGRTSIDCNKIENNSNNNLCSEDKNAQQISKKHPVGVAAGPPRSVAVILQQLKRQILAGCTITFSGLIPTNEENPRNHTLWRLAESLGAQVSMDMLPRTTHLIAGQTQTQKVAAVLQKRASEVWVLHPDWLIYCRWSLSRCHEATFMLNQLPPGQALPNPKMDYTPIAPPPAPSSSCSASTSASASSQRTATGENSTNVPALASLSDKKDGEGKLTVVAQTGARKRPREECVEDGEVVETQPKKSADTASTAPAVKKATAGSAGPLDSMLSTLSRLKAVGAGAASAPPDAFLLPQQLLALASRSANENGDATRRGPSPVFGDANRKKQLSQLLAQTAHPLPSTTSSAGALQQKASSNSVGQIGVIKKKVNALALERDSSGEEVRGDRKFNGASGKTVSSASVSVPVARPEDIDTSYRIRCDSANSEDDYFSLDYEKTGQEAEEALALGEVGSAQGTVSSRSTGNDNASTTGHSDNSLLGEGDGEYATLQDEEGAELLEGDSVTADEGMLCCDDDQGSTCSATAQEGRETWGQCKMRRLREQQREMAADLDAGDEAPGYGGAFQSPILSGGAVPLQRIDSACSAGAQNSSASASDDDDCSDFEVMMSRQRARMEKESRRGGLAEGSADCPIVLD